MVSSEDGGSDESGKWRKAKWKEKREVLDRGQPLTGELADSSLPH